MQYGSDFADLTPMTAAEAEERVQKWEGWQPIYEALTEIEESLEESAAYFANNPLLPQLYWTSHSTSEFPSTASKFPKIRRSNFNGSVVQDVISRLSTLGTPYDLAFSVSIGKLYWTDWGTGKIQRANLDGSHVEDLVTGANGLKAPTFLALDLAGGKMYWTDWGNIQRANLDGSRIEDLITGLNTPNGLALDGYGGKMYWTDSGQIQRANLDGSGVQTLITTGLLDSPRFLALDLAGGKMYWIDRDGSLDRSKIQRASLDGSGVENLVTGLNTPHGLTLDVAGGKMYWTDNGTGKIQCANLDGSRVQDLITGLDNPVGLALDVVGGGPAPIPTVKNVFISSRPASGDTYRAGETIEVTVEFTEPVYVTGVPAVRLGHNHNNIPEYHDMVARYVNVAGSGSVYMVFRYVVTISDYDPDGVSLASDPIVLTTGPGSGTVRNNADQDADLSYPSSRWVRAIGAHKMEGPIPYLVKAITGKLYWTKVGESDMGNGSIHRANGSDIEDLITGLDKPYGLALDLAGGKMYWTNRRKILRANLDGSDIEDLITGLDKPYGLALDLAGGKMYWTDWGAGKILRANLDGSDIEDLITGLNTPNGLALDVAGGKIYWTDSGTGKLLRANLDGSDIEDLITGLGHWPASLALDVAGGQGSESDD